MTRRGLENAEPDDSEADLDDIDRQILSILRENPGFTDELLAKETPLGLSAIKRRRSGLVKRGYLQKGWIVRPQKEILPYRCLVHTKLNIYELGQSPLKTVESFVTSVIADVHKRGYHGRLIVEDVYEVFGDSDTVFELLAEDQKCAARFILECISSKRGVVGTVTQTAFLWRKHVERHEVAQ